MREYYCSTFCLVLKVSEFTYLKQQSSQIQLATLETSKGLGTSFKIDRLANFSPLYDKAPEVGSLATFDRLTRSRINGFQNWDNDRVCIVRRDVCIGIFAVFESS